VTSVQRWVWDGSRGVVLGGWPVPSPHNEEPCPTNVPHLSCQSNGEVQATTIRFVCGSLCFFFLENYLYSSPAAAKKVARDRCSCVQIRGAVPNNHQLEIEERPRRCVAGGRSLSLARPVSREILPSRWERQLLPGHENQYNASPLLRPMIR
jgi:hypothetical protein